MFPPSPAPENGQERPRRTRGTPFKTATNREGQKPGGDRRPPEGKDTPTKEARGARRDRRPPAPAGIGGGNRRGKRQRRERRRTEPAATEREDGYRAAAANQSNPTGRDGQRQRRRGQRQWRPPGAARRLLRRPEAFRPKGARLEPPLSPHGRMISDWGALAPRGGWGVWGEGGRAHGWPPYCRARANERTEGGTIYAPPHRAAAVAPRSSEPARTSQEAGRSRRQHWAAGAPPPV